MFFEVVRAVLFSCGGTPIHPFVNPSALSGSRSGRLGPDTEYSVATVSRTKAVSIKITLDNRAESMHAVRLALRPRGPLLHQAGGPMQPTIPSLRFLLWFSSHQGGTEKSYSPAHPPWIVSIVIHRLCCLGFQFLPRWAAYCIGCVVFHHVPDDRRQPTHHGYSGDLRASPLFDPAVPCLRPRVTSQDV